MTSDGMTMRERHTVTIITNAASAAARALESGLNEINVVDGPASIVRRAVDVLNRVLLLERECHEVWRAQSELPRWDDDEEDDDE